MVSKLLYALERGWAQLISNGKLVFLAAILFVLPLLFIVVLEGFYAAAAANVQTAEQQRVGAIHDAVEALVREKTDISQALTTIASKNSDITKFRLLDQTSQEIIKIIAAADESLIGATTTESTALRIANVTPGDTFEIPMTTESGRIIQAVRFITTPSGEYYLFSEHSRVAFDTTLQKRKQDAYLLLSLLFFFLIALAYWVNRQTDWERKYTKLASTLQERDLFSNMIAHEFRTPLTAIKGYASFLQESKTLTAEESRFADVIGDSAQRLVLLVNDFLEVARIQSGRMKLEKTEVDVREPIKEVFVSLQAKAAEKKLQLVYTPSLKAQILKTDRNRFIQILTNIISNSIKYTNAGTVEISCEVDRHGVTIRVKDTGMGISAEDQQKLFAPFSRVGGVEKSATTGTGLGMWITKQMIELLGGTIAVESIKDVGTHVVLHFKR